MNFEINMKEGITKASKAVLIIGILILILGILAVIYPENFGKTSVKAIGVILIIGGILRMTFAAVSFSMGSMLLRYLYAILMVVAGVWIFMNPDMGLEVLTIVMGIYFIVDGVTGFIYSFSLAPLGGGSYMMIGCVISIVLGILIFSKWPESSGYALGIYLGVKLVIDGFSTALTGYLIRAKALDS